MKIKAALFDLDGTLLDSLHVWHTVDDIFLAQRGYEVPDDYQQCVAALTYEECARYTIGRFHLDDTVEGLMNEWNAIAEKEYRYNVQIMPDARHYLEKLQKAGIRLAVATTLPEFILRPCLQRNEINTFFETVFNPDKVGIGKHNPEFFRRVAEKLGLEPSECIVFDDVPDVISAASSAGMHTCGMLGRNADVNERLKALGRTANGFLWAPAPDSLI